MEKCLAIRRKSNNFAAIYKLMEIIIHLKDKRDMRMKSFAAALLLICLLYTSDAADELTWV